MNDQYNCVMQGTFENKPMLGLPVCSVEDYLEWPRWTRWTLYLTFAMLNRVIDFCVNGDFSLSTVLNASAPAGMACADCAIDGEPCPDCYKAWWQKRHLSVKQGEGNRIGYLVINDNKNALFLSFGERYKLFSDHKKAIAHAQSIGFKDTLGLGINLKPGTLNVYQGGDTKVSLFSLLIPE